MKSFTASIFAIVIAISITSAAPATEVTTRQTSGGLIEVQLFGAGDSYTTFVNLDDEFTMTSKRDMPSVLAKTNLYLYRQRSNR
jgi:hypothetical protein